MSIEYLMTRANAPAAPALPTMPPSGRVVALVQNLGLVLGGVRSEAYCAFAWRYARDDIARVNLQKHLGTETLKIASRYSWPSRMRGKRYFAQLCWLAIWEEHNWWWIRQGRAWPRLVGMDDELWEHRVAEKYSIIRDVLDRWCSEANRRAWHNIDGKMAR